MRPYLKKPFTGKGWWSGSRSRLLVQTLVPQKKEKERNKEIHQNTKAKKALCISTS
jgi:hypothetical protein